MCCLILAVFYSSYVFLGSAFASVLLFFLRPCCPTSRLFDRQRLLRTAMHMSHLSASLFAEAEGIQLFDELGGVNRLPILNSGINLMEIVEELSSQLRCGLKGLQCVTGRCLGCQAPDARTHLRVWPIHNTRLAYQRVVHRTDNSSVGSPKKPERNTVSKMKLKWLEMAMSALISVMPQSNSIVAPVLK